MLWGFFKKLIIGDRRGNYADYNNRCTTENSAGYTLNDFKEAFNGLYKIYKKKGMNVYLAESDEFLNEDN